MLSCSWFHWSAVCVHIFQQLWDHVPCVYNATIHTKQHPAGNTNIEDLTLYFLIDTSKKSWFVTQWNKIEFYVFFTHIIFSFLDIASTSRKNFFFIFENFLFVTVATQASHWEWYCNHSLSGAWGSSIYTQNSPIPVSTCFHHYQGP